MPDKQEDTPLEITSASLRNKLTVTSEPAPEAKNMTLRLPVELHARLVPLAKKNHRSVHGQIVAMLEEGADREEKKK